MDDQSEYERARERARRMRTKQVSNSPTTPQVSRHRRTAMSDYAPRRGSLASMLAAADTLVANARALLPDASTMRPTSSLARRVSAVILPYHHSNTTQRSSSVDAAPLKVVDAPKAALRASALARLAKAAMRRVSAVGRVPMPNTEMLHKCEPESALASRCASANRCLMAPIVPETSSKGETDLLAASSSLEDRRSSGSSAVIIPAPVQDYYTPAMMQLRARLRWDAKIRRQALKLWRTAKLNRSGMGKDEYLDFHLSVYRWLLHGAAFDEEDALRSGLEDWKRDVETGTTLSCDKFLKSLYELADVYVDSVERDAYVSFLQALFANVTASTADRSRTGKRSWRYRWPEERKQELDSSFSLDKQEADRGEHRPTTATKKSTRTTWDMLRAAINGDQLVRGSP